MRPARGADCMSFQRRCMQYEVRRGFAIKFWGLFTKIPYTPILACTCVIACAICLHSLHRGANSDFNILLVLRLCTMSAWFCLHACAASLHKLQVCVGGGSWFVLQYFRFMLLINMKFISKLLENFHWKIDHIRFLVFDFP